MQTVDSGVIRRMSLQKGPARISLALNGRLNCYLSKPAGLIMNDMVFLLGATVSGHRSAASA